jgi:hypothetical protein
MDAIHGPRVVGARLAVPEHAHASFLLARSIHGPRRRKTARRRALIRSGRGGSPFLRVRSPPSCGPAPLNGRSRLSVPVLARCLNSLLLLARSLLPLKIRSFILYDPILLLLLTDDFCFPSQGGSAHALYYDRMHAKISPQFHASQVRFS